MRCGLSVLAGIPVAVLLLNIAGMFTAPQQQRRIRFAATSFQRRQQMRGLTAEVSTVGPPHLSYPPPPPPPLPAYPDCNGTAHAELWGALVLAGPENTHNTAQECCASCRQYEPTLDVLNGGQCNAWVWSPETKHCWLKHQKPNELQHAVKMLAERRARPNPKIVWTSGVLLETKTCSDCVTPASYNGCIGKDGCNATGRVARRPSTAISQSAVLRQVAHGTSLLGSGAEERAAGCAPRAARGLRRAGRAMGDRAQEGTVGGLRASLPRLSAERAGRRALWRAAV